MKASLVNCYSLIDDNFQWRNEFPKECWMLRTLFYLQSCQRLQVADAILMNHCDFIRLQIQFRCFGWNAAWNLFEFISWAPNDGSSARARWWAVAFAQATFVRVAKTFEFMRWQITNRNITNLSRCSTVSAGKSALTQPIRKPCQMTVTVEWIRCKIPGILQTLLALN